MQLKTQRLILRETRETDGPILLAYQNAPEFKEFEADPVPSAEEFHNIIGWIIDSQSEIPRTHYYLAIALQKQPEHPIGSIYISIRNYAARQAEIGYMLGVAYWNNGYVTEAARQMLEYGFENLRLHRIYADNIITENKASITIVEKLGFRKEAHFRETHYFNGRWWDTYQYAMLRTEWKTGPASKL